MDTPTLAQTGRVTSCGGPHSPGTAFHTGPGHRPQKSKVGSRSPRRHQLPTAPGLAFVGKHIDSAAQRNSPPINEGGRTI